MASMFTIMRNRLMDAYDDPFWKERVQSLDKMDIAGFYKYYQLGYFGPNMKEIQ